MAFGNTVTSFGVP